MIIKKLEMDSEVHYMCPYEDRDVCASLRRSPERRQLCFAVKAGWEPSCCRLSSVYAMVPSAVLVDRYSCSVSGRPEKQCG